MDIEIKKINKLGGPGIIVAAVMLVFVILVIILYNSGVGLANDIGIREPVFTDVDFSLAPQSVVDDARVLADELAGDDEARQQVIMEQLVGSYLAASNADIVIIFNSGGMGWNYVKDTPGWESILNGIIAKLQELGQRPLLINYCRTNRGLWGSVKEMLEASTRYTRKVDDEVKRIEYLVDHLPDIKVIIAGESTGTVLTEETMSYFRDRANVYSIQTGNPFWYRARVQERTLRINTNGTCDDAFSYGNVPGMVWATFKHWIGLSSLEDNPGDILKWLKAPGHHYSWQYDGISSAISGFLEDNFGQ
ncbi:MAG: hypothetical protein JXA17_07085 [Dehalococcoidales bacterium]|nr:hypothetical protein [Dehalococcoidales bacterium]